MLHDLQLIEDQVGFTGLCDMSADMIIEGQIICQIPVTQRFQVHMQDIFIRQSAVCQVLMKQIQQRGFPASADAGYDFD